MLYTKPILLATAFFFAVVVHAENTVMDMIQNTPELSTFYRYLTSPRQEHLERYLSNRDAHLTVFAPVNEAFDRINQMLSTRANTTLSERQWRRALAFHIVPDQVISSRDMNMGYQQYPTLYNIMTMPTAKMRTHLARTQVPEDLTEGVIIYNGEGRTEVLRGLGIPANFIRTDIRTSNGIIHVIDHVLFPPFTFVKTLQLRGLNKVLESLRFANALDDFESFANVTYLVPTNEAVTRFTSTHSDISPSSLRNILLTHVIPGYYFSQDLSSRQVFSLPTKSGEVIQFSNLPGSAPSIGDAVITKPDILTDSGVFHEIDKVILPSEMKTTRGGE